MSKLSVIVPMYNVESYLRQCLDSLENQTLADFEVILVDDGCTDQTPQIAKEYTARRPDRFRMVHRANGGLSAARNTGIREVNSEYIAFLDSDDFIEPTLYEKMVQRMDEGADVVVTDIEYWYSDASKRFSMSGLTDWSADIVSEKAMLSPMFAWNKMYRTRFFKEEQLYYPEGTWYEDIPVTTRIFARTEKIAYLNECLIHYRQREGSIMSARNTERIKEIFGVMEMVRHSFEVDGTYERYFRELEYLHIEHLRLYGMFRFIRSPHWAECYRQSEAVMNTCFPNWKQNRYLSNLGFKNRLFLKYYNERTAWLFHLLIR